MVVLGIETSCDETAVALVTDQKEILSNIIHSQIVNHQEFGGVVPEIGARIHLQYLPQIIRQCVREAKIPLKEIDGIAATCGPGLIGGVIVGAMMGKAIAAFQEKPFIAINHLEAHALTVRLTHKVDFPYLLLLISGGHCQLLVTEGVGKFCEVGTTLDDAVGESFDKVAKMLGLPYPGGPSIEQAAKGGDPLRFKLPRPLIHQEGCNFSFSGLKTAVRYEIEKLISLTDQDRFDMAASFQQAVAEVLRNRSLKAIQQFPEIKTFVMAGGVASNYKIRSELETHMTPQGVSLLVPTPSLCTDNGAMVAWAGIERLKLGFTNSLNFEPKPRWPLNTL